MATLPVPQPQATKASRRYLYLTAGLITAIIACMLALAWPRVRAANTAVAKATAVADVQRSKGAELYQARQRWETRTFNNYRLHIQFGPSDSPDCEKVFEVHEPVQTKTVSDTCAGRYEAELLTFLGAGGSVSGLFSYIDNEISHVGECVGYDCRCYGGRTINVAYDTDYGYPKSVEIQFVWDWPIEAENRPCTLMYFAPPRPFRASVNPIK